MYALQRGANVDIVTRMSCSILLLLLVSVSTIASLKNSVLGGIGINGKPLPKVAVSGATGYIGRNVVKELVSQGIPTVALVRSTNYSSIVSRCLDGAEIVQCETTNVSKTYEAISCIKPDVVVNCAASRSGVPKDSWAVDYGVGKNLLAAMEKLAESSNSNNNKNLSHYVLLSAYCCGKPILQFQYAKLKLEEEIRQSKYLSHSIVRPTAFFKSLDGQLESANKGYPILYFGDGSCAANAVGEKDLAEYLVDCAVRPADIDMYNTCRNVGGPDVPPITKTQQIQLIYDTLKIAPEKRKTISIPIGIFDVLINTFQIVLSLGHLLSAIDLIQKMEDAVELAKIVRYYATEPMVAVHEKEVIGSTKLEDHFAKIAARGGELEEIDKMTTTTGVLEVFSKDSYAKQQ